MRPASLPRDEKGGSRLGREHAPLHSLAGLAATDAPRLGALSAQLACCAVIVWQYQLQSKAFLKVLLVALAGLPLHHLLPQRMRMACFSMLSLAAIGWVLGPANSLWLVGLGLALLALCHAPAPFWPRVAALGSAGALLAALRAGWLPAPVPAAVWPILGSMFMFRLVVYLYDLRTRAAPFGFWRSLAYFFMLPNVCFPLFPIVDYKTFCRSHFAASPLDTYQRGVAWILRGLLHLLLYRIVKRHLLVDPLEVRSAGELARFLVANFLLYLRISGDFHLIVGMLHLFGFGLPVTQHFYVLSSSVTDFWRRINIYWRDFMEKLFFRPIFFRVRRRGEGTAMVVAILGVFAATWLLHSYQSFWIRGDFPLRWQDLAFWSVFGGCMVLNLLHEARRPTHRTLKPSPRRWRSDALRGLRVVGIFGFVVTLWSLWSAASFEGWVEMMSRARVVGARDALLLGLGAGGLALAAIALGGSPRERAADRLPAAGAPSAVFWRSTARVAIPAALLAVLGARPGLLIGDAQALAYVEELKAERMTQQEAKAQERGYYEGLTNVTRLGNELAALYLAPLGWNRFNVVRETDGFPRFEHIPNFRGTYNQKPWSTNRWGMRDRDYELSKAPGTVRIGLFGSSHCVGVGVADGETYESLVELRLNRERGSAGASRRYEILNFSVGGYGPYERLIAIRRSAARFGLDVVAYSVANDLDWMVRDVVSSTRSGPGVPDRYVADVAERAQVTSGTAADVAARRLMPHAEELLSWVYAELAASARENGYSVVALLLPKPERETGWRDDAPRLRSLLDRAGVPVVDATRAYDRVESWEELWVAPWDKHPNARGHRLLADAIYPGLLGHLAGAAPPAGRPEAG